MSEAAKLGSLIIVRQENQRFPVAERKGNTGVPGYLRRRRLGPGVEAQRLRRRCTRRLLARSLKSGGSTLQVEEAPLESFDPILEPQICFFHHVFGEQIRCISSRK